MIEGVFNKSTYLRKAKISVKAAVSALLIALAVVLPQTVHIAGGAAGGAKWLPMYLPVLIGGCLLGRKWGLGVGVLSPVVSFVITAAAGNAMPAAERLPLMIAELTVFAAVTGSFSDKIAETPAAAFPAVFIAQITGRAVYVAPLSWGDPLMNRTFIANTSPSAAATAAALLVFMRYDFHR